MTRPSPAGPPATNVLAAFGAVGMPERLAGGRETTWRAGSVVLKPADTSEAMLAWQAGVLAGIRPDGVRITWPRASEHGKFVVDGWSATTFCSGRHEPRRWIDIIAAGRRLHRALETVPRPDILASRSDAWAVADRAAWGDISLGPYRDAPHVSRLERRLRPVQMPSQVIHGDLTGNVLFAAGLPPAVIDLAAYWRPAELATAIVVADALAWEGATVDDLGPVIETGAFGQLLARALLYRIVADVSVDADRADSLATAYAVAVDVAVSLTCT
jgi:uncharacterized protein (TIGR02569 family)